MSFRRSSKVIERCILMTTDPGDLVLDPTCGSGTTAYVAEQWGRRWITIDTSRVALALARTRLMSARYPYYLLADSPEGRRKEQEVSGKILPDAPTHQDIRQGFVYERAPHVTLKSIANNAEIDVIYEKWQAKLEPLRAQLNAALGKNFEEWEIPREAVADMARRGARRPMRDGGRAASPARRRSTPRSPRRPTSSCSTTGPTKTRRKRARRRPVHRREPVAASRRPLRRGGADRPRRRRRGRAPPLAQDHAADRLRRDGAGASAHGRRPPGREARHDPLHRAEPVARRIYRRRRPLHGGRDRAARRDLHRPGVRHPRHASTSSPPRARRWTRASTR